MIYPKENRLVRWVFRKYFLLGIKYNFDKIIFEPVSIDYDSAILLIANHYSYWDGFILYWLNEKLFHKKFYVMALEESVIKLPFLKYLGVFSVKKNSRGVIKSLDYAATLLADPHNLVLIFPQGKMCSNFVDSVQMEHGVSKIIAKAKGNIQTIFTTSFTENFKFKKPSVYIYLQNEGSKKDTTSQDFQQFYKSAKAKQAEISY